MKHIIFVLLMTLGLSARSATLDTIITSGPNKGMTIEQVVQYRVEGIAKIAREAKLETLQTKDDLQTIQSKYDKVIGERDWFHADDNVHIAGETFWRKRAQVVLYALALGFAWRAFCLAKQVVGSPSSSPLGVIVPAAGFLQILFPYVVALIGAAVGYAFGLFVLGWISRFLP